MDTEGKEQEHTTVDLSLNEGQANAPRSAYSHPDDICYKCYYRGTATVPPHRSPDCGVDYRRKEMPFAIFRTSKSYRLQGK